MHQVRPALERHRLEDGDRGVEDVVEGGGAAIGVERRVEAHLAGAAVVGAAAAAVLERHRRAQVAARAHVARLGGGDRGRRGACEAGVVASVVEAAAEELDADDGVAEEEEAEEEQHVAQGGQRLEDGDHEQPHARQPRDAPQRPQHAEGAQRGEAASGRELRRPRDEHDEPVEAVPALGKVAAPRLERRDAHGRHLDHHLGGEEACEDPLEGGAPAVVDRERILGCHGDAVGEDQQEHQPVEPVVLDAVDGPRARALVGPK